MSRTLEILIKKHKTMLEEIQKDLKDLYLQKEDDLERIKALDHQLQEEQKSFEVGEMPPFSIDRFIKAVGLKKQDLFDHIEVLDHQIDLKQDELFEEFQDVKKYTVILEAQIREKERQLALLEQKNFDEIASLRRG